ncbi:632_t:CDS:2 [Cetraspora pellucida]|uniref:632_t:CDS:1 n=1 Tax=Cetraspora pellucida TaxID=1433469 RepID=A0A9N8Z095_9GLOM|nr:632_t:CDS:2 [Cetraspora pellucida]
MNDATINTLGWKADKPSDFAIKSNSKHISESLGWYTDVPISVKDKDGKIVMSTGNFAHINNDEPEPMLCLGMTWIRKVQAILDPNKNQFQMKLHDKDNKHIQCDLKQSNNDKEKLSKHTYQLINKVKRLSSELDSLISQITRKDISLNESKIKIKDLQSKIKILEMKLSSTQNELKEITALRSMKKILEDKLESAQKDAFSTQKEILKKEFKIISLKSELTNTKNELVNTKNELASKINKIECLGALCSVLQKTKDILDPVKSKTHCSAIVKGGEEKNMQSEEQSFISNSRDTSESRPEGSLLCRPFKGDSSSHKSLAKYFKNKTLPIITNNQNSESLIQDITNNQNPESLIQDITIKETVCAGEALVNDKNIFHPLPPSCSLNSKPNYSHRMTASDNLFSGIYSQSEDTNVPKLTMNEQSEEAVLRVPNSSDIQKNQKKELLQNKPEGKVFIGMNSKGKTNIVGNLVLENKAENIYKAFVRYMYGVIAGNPKASYYENIRFKYISPEKILSVKSFSPKRSTVIIFEGLCNASMVINSYLRKNEFIVFDLTRSEDNLLAIRLRFDTPLDLQKEIELRQKHKIKNALPAEPMNFEPKKTEKSDT